eukprot:1157509-Pelagomonas_calceolata.AAC.7
MLGWQMVEELCVLRRLCGHKSYHMIMRVLGPNPGTTALLWLELRCLGLPGYPGNERLMSLGLESAGIRVACSPLRTHCTVVHVQICPFLYARQPCWTPVQGVPTGVKQLCQLVNLPEIDEGSW